MFIKCPKCNTSYDVPDNYIGEDGQNVKCVNCTNIWFQEKTKINNIEKKEEESANIVENSEDVGFHITSNFLAEAVEDNKETETELENSFELEEEEKKFTSVEHNSYSGLESLDKIDNKIKEEMEKNVVSDEEEAIDVDLSILDEVDNDVQNIDEGKQDDDLANLIKFAKSGIEVEEENVEVDEIVSRLSKFNKQTDDVEHSDDFLDKILFKIFKEKAKKMNISKIKRYITGFFIALLLVFIGVFFHGRYVITKYIPVTKYVYNVLRIPAVIAGEGLEFKNVTKREYEEDYERKMEVKGFIVNKTEDSIELPLIYIELLDKEGGFLQKQIAEASIDNLTPGASTGFTVTIDSASRFAKYIVTSFRHKKGINGI
jgi:predicted Zn finger-like uncharacterized protein